MHCQSKDQSKYHALQHELVAKISRLRQRLVACGYSIKEITEIILFQFFELPKINWKNLDETNNFYEVKSSFKVNSNCAEIIMRLQKMVPNLHTCEVCEYLLAMIELHASDYGFCLEESSSDSNDSNSGIHRLFGRRPIKRHLKPKKEEKCEKTKKNIMEKESECTKRAHYDSEYLLERNRKKEVDDYFKTRPIEPIISYFEDEDVLKEMKKIPESEDSDSE